jgi:hypothetical protein
MPNSPSSPIVIFQTSRGIRLAETLFAIVELAIGLPLIALLIAGIGYLVYKCCLPFWPLCISCIIGLLFAIYGIRFMWEEVIPRFRFSVTFHSNYLQLGRGLARLNIPYEELEMFGYAEKFSKNRLGFLWRGHRVRIQLPTASLPSCLELLHERCVNAVFLDHAGHEHLPQNPSMPHISLLTLYRHYRGLMFGCIGGLITAIFSIIYFASGIAACVFGQAPQGQLAVYLFELSAAIIAVPVSLVAYKHYSNCSQVLSLSIPRLQNETELTNQTDFH